MLYFESYFTEMQFVDLAVKITEEEEQIVKVSIIATNPSLPAFSNVHKGVVDGFDGCKVAVGFPALVSPKEGVAALQNDARQL